MVRNADEIFEAAKSLSMDDRSDLVDRLLATFTPEHMESVMEAWLQVAEERYDAYLRGEGTNHDGGPIIEKLARGERP